MAVKTSKISNYEFLFPKEDVKYINQDNIPVLSFDSEPGVLGGNDPISYTVAIPISRVPDGGSSSAHPLGAGGGGGGNRSPGAGGGGGGGGGGEEEETAGNNLSFPVIWSEGSGLSLAGTPGEITLSTPYNAVLYPFDTDGDGQPETNAYAFAQKTDGNVWQAGNVSVPAPSSEGAAPVYVTEVDWGDSLESVDMKVGRPVRVELSLYKALGTTYEGETTLPDAMTAFPMTMLDNPSSPDEVQGAGSYTSDGSQPLEYESAEASVYSAGAKLIIQRLVGTREDVADGDLKWNGSQWVDANADPTDVFDPLTGITFGAEVNVGGKIIYGLSKGGWRPTAAGDYRITFYMEPNANAQLDHASIRVSEEEGVAIAAEEGTDVGGTAYVLNGPDPLSGEDRNLTYIDIRVTSGRGGGNGGKGGGKPKLALAEPINLGASDLSLSNVAPNEGLNRMPLAAIGAANPLNGPLGS